jgi:flagellar capping protein FliD
VQLVSGFIPSGSSAYNSLASVGLKLDTASTTVGTTDANDSSDSSDSNQNDSNFTVNATSGRLAPLDVTAFEAAYAANTTAVASLFTNVPAAGLNASQIAAGGVSYGFAYQFGTLLSGASGIATFLKNSAITPGGYQSSLLNSVIDSNDLEIKSLQSQVDTITKEANTQANQLRAQYSASETQIAELQSLQGEISAIGH